MLSFSKLNGKNRFPLDFFDLDGWKWRTRKPPRWISGVNPPVWKLSGFLPECLNDPHTDAVEDCAVWCGTDLLPVLHPAHGARSAALHPHGVPLRARGSVALGLVGASLLGRRSAGRPLLMLGIGVRPYVGLAPHLPYLVHRAGRLGGHKKETCYHGDKTVWKMCRLKIWIWPW